MPIPHFLSGFGLHFGRQAFHAFTTPRKPRHRVLRALLTQLGCEVVDLGIVPDDLDTTRKVLREAAQGNDLIVLARVPDLDDPDADEGIALHLVSDDVLHFGALDAPIALILERCVEREMPPL